MSSHPPSRAESKHHGLRNEGSTCYLNSVLHVLFMTPEFREAIQTHRDTPQTSHIDTQLKHLFDELTTGSLPRRKGTELILRGLGIENVWKQRDAAEYFEKILNLASPQSSQIFHGGLIHYIECSKCGQSTQESGSFWTLNLTISQTCTRGYSVEDGLKAFFSKSHLTSDNQLYCDNCEEKADTTLECKLGDAPKVLLVLLKRFEFSYYMMDYVKNDSPVNVPFNIEIPKGGGYELYATVDHTGSLSGGHYTATIRVPDDGGRWYRFNDSVVTLENNFNPLKSQSAYLLLYKRQRLMESRPEVHSGSSVDPAGFDTAQKEGAAVTTPGDDNAGHDNEDHGVALLMKRQERQMGTDPAAAPPTEVTKATKVTGSEGREANSTNNEPMIESRRGGDNVMEGNDMEVDVMGGGVGGDDVKEGGDVMGVSSTVPFVSRVAAFKAKRNKRKTSPTRQGGSPRGKKNKRTSGFACLLVCTRKQTSDSE